MNYQHRFRVNAPVQAVADFHSRLSAMAAITPPPILVQVHKAPEHLAEGDEMDFTLWLGPLPIHWVARFEDVTATSSSTARYAGQCAVGGTSTASSRSTS